MAEEEYSEGQDNVSLTQLINASFDYHSSRINTSIVGSVIGVSNELGRINVKPSIRYLDVSGDQLELPSIINVPILLPSSQRGGFLFPLTTNDNVYLVFSQRGIDTWKHGSVKDATARDFRKFSIKDCVAIPCVNPFTLNMNAKDKHIWSHSGEDVVVFHNSRTGRETEIRLLSDGGIIINTNQDIVVNCDNSTLNVNEHTEVNTKSATVNVEEKVEVNSDTAEINIASEANITCPESTWEGDINMTGRLAVKGEVVSNGVQLDAHIHAGVTSGNSTSTQPY